MLLKIFSNIFRYQILQQNDKSIYILTNWK